MIYLMLTHRIRPDKLGEYDEVYAESVRLWQKHGCNVIGVWTNWIGGDDFELTRIYSFKNFAEYEEIDVKVHNDPDWIKFRKRSGECSMGRTTKLLRPTKYSPLQ